MADFNKIENLIRQKRRNAEEALEKYSNIGEAEEFYDLGFLYGEIKAYNTILEAVIKTSPDFFDKLRAKYSVDDFTGFLGQISGVITDPEENANTVAKFIYDVYCLAADILEGKES